MARNTGKPSEQSFEAHFAAFGKRAFVHRLVDAAEIRGRTGKVGEARPQPSDYIVVFDGQTFFAEVKSTTHERNFSFSLLRPTQSAAAKQVLSAGGSYLIFIHKLAGQPQWYQVPYSFIQQSKSLNKGSLSWQELTQWKITIET